MKGNDENDKFEGLFLQARYYSARDSQSNYIVKDGQFSQLDSDLKTMECESNTKVDLKLYYYF